MGLGGFSKLITIFFLSAITPMASNADSTHAIKSIFSLGS
jgi:hypothetical protein